MKEYPGTKIIAERIKAARQDNNLSQADLGAKLGLSKVGYGEYERGNRAFDAELLFRLARILGRPVEHFLGLPTGLTGREERVVALFRLAEGAGYGDLVIGAVHAMVAQLLRPPGEVGQAVRDKT